MFILVRQTICGAMLIRVGKLQFIGLIGGRILTWGRRVPEAADKIAVYRVKVFLFELF